MTELYFAPMEGVTPWHYRQTHREMFGGVERYYTPFLTPTEGGLAGKPLRDVLPEHNEGTPVVPQILTNNSERFLLACKVLEQLGYTEVDLNLGCPSGTVVGKGRGAGFLAKERREELERFLEEVFAVCPLKISLKTRLGMDDPAEFAALLELYNRFPAGLLTVHARVREDYYKRPVNRAAFGRALAACKLPLCYNGDIFTAADLRAFTEAFPTVRRVMLGRGIVANPALAREIKGGAPLAADELRAFHDALFHQIRTLQSGDKNALCRIKEQWNYWGALFEEGEKPLKHIRKASRIPDYEAAVNEMFCHPLHPEWGYRLV